MINIRSIKVIYNPELISFFNDKSNRFNCKIEFNKNSTVVEIFIIFFLYHCYCRIAIFRQSPTAVCFNYF